MSTSKLEKQLIKDLCKRKENGMPQNEIELLYGYSRSYVSETLNKMESSSEIIRKTEGKLIKRIWLREYFPGFVKDYIRIGFMKSTEHIPFLKAAKIMAEADHYELSTKIYDDAVEMLNDLRNKTLDIALCPMFTQILFSLISKEVLIIGLVSSGGSAILENKKSKSEVCASSESSSVMMMVREHFGEGKYEIKTIKNPVRASKDFLSDKYHYMAIWEPYVTALKKNDCIREITTYNNVLGDFPCCSIGTNETSYKERYHFLKSLMSKYKEIPEGGLSIENLEDVISDVWKYYKTSKTDIESSLKEYNFLPEYSIGAIKRYLEHFNLAIPDDRIAGIFKMI